MSALTDIAADSIFEPDGLFASVQRPAMVPLLQADPELGRALAPQDWRRADHAARAHVIHLDQGIWEPHLPGRLEGALGVLIVEGLVCRSVSVGAERSSEILGAGDLLRPWSDDVSDALPASREYEVLVPSQVALLDRAFAQRVALFPEIMAELTDRAVRRARAQAVLIATSHIKRVDVRLLALFWHLAERWGRVTPRGIVVPIKLTHTRLAALVGAQRPSVTTVLKRMADRGTLCRDAEGYVLGDNAREELEQLCLSRDARHLRVLQSSSDRSS